MNDFFYFRRELPVVRSIGVSTEPVCCADCCAEFIVSILSTSVGVIDKFVRSHESMSGTPKTVFRVIFWLSVIRCLQRVAFVAVHHETYLRIREVRLRVSRAWKVSKLDASTRLTAKLRAFQESVVALSSGKGARDLALALVQRATRDMAPSFEEWIPRIADDVFIIPPRLRNDESNFGLEPAQHRPFFGLELGADDLKLQDRVVDRDKDLVATAKEIANQYVPGEAEQEVFAAAIASSSSSGNASSVVARRSTRSADALQSLWYQLPIGVFVYRDEYNTERYRHGDVYFTDDVKASDVFTLDDNNPSPAADWQTKVEFLLKIAKDFADDRNTFVPAPQAAYATGGNHSKSGPKISQVVTGSRTMRFEKIYLTSKDDAGPIYLARDFSYGSAKCLAFAS